MLLIRNRPWFACYEEPVLGATGATGGATGTTGPDDDIMRDQNHLNSTLKKEKEKFRAEREKLVKQLEQVQSTVRLTEEQRNAMETQIEDLKLANMTVEERARHALTSAEKKASEALASESAKAKKWEAEYHDLKIGYEIKSAAGQHKVISGVVDVLESHLKPVTRLVDDLDEDGKPTGTRTAKVKFKDVDAKGKPVVLDLTVDETIKRMKELPDRFGSFFEGAAVGGVGGNTGTGARKQSVAGMSTAEYMEQRKKDPASLGLVK